MTGCTETAVIVNFYYFFLIRLFLNSIFSDWYFCTVQDRCLLITSSCSLMRSACGPGSKATSMTLAWGQETTAAIKSLSRDPLQDLWEAFQRADREQSGKKKKKKHKRRGSASSSCSKTLEEPTPFELWSQMWSRWMRVRLSLFRHSEPGAGVQSRERQRTCFFAF